MLENIFGKDNNPFGNTSIPDDKIKSFLNRLKDGAKKVGVTVTRKVLQGLFLLLEIVRSPEVSVADKILVVGVILYIFKKGDLINDALGIFGLVDDTAFAALEYKRLKKIITPEMIRNANSKAENQLFDWGMVDVA
ncbi:MAG: DUF1232 domain-containing protein [Bacteroidales bacterium]|nr:DUF1232 domain-containing protein [Bacteroidales bacterium]